MLLHAFLKNILQTINDQARVRGNNSFYPPSSGRFEFRPTNQTMNNVFWIFLSLFNNIPTQRLTVDYSRFRLRPFQILI